MLLKIEDKFLLGAGTIVNGEQAKEAISLGAKFIVSPGLSESVANVCKETNTLYIPGAATPTEIISALNLGLTYVKFFPASVWGGMQAINAIGAAFPQVSFLPTGGINVTNLLEYLSNTRVFACGGSMMLKGTPEDIKKNCLEAIKILEQL